MKKLEQIDADEEDLTNLKTKAWWAATPPVVAALSKDLDCQRWHRQAVVVDGSVACSHLSLLGVNPFEVET